MSRNPASIGINANIVNGVVKSLSGGEVVRLIKQPYQWAPNSANRVMGRANKGKKNRRRSSK